MTLLEEVINSYDNSIIPDRQIIDKINNLVEFIPKKELIKRDLIHTLNIISKGNKEKNLVKFEQIVKLHWNTKFNDIFFSILKSNNPSNIDVSLSMFEFLSLSDQNYILNNMYDSNLSNIEMKTCGVFLGKLYSKYDDAHWDLKEQLANIVDIKPFLVIHVYLTLLLDNKLDLICNQILRKLQKLNLNTSTMMLFYDLEDLCLEKGIPI